MPSVVYDNMIKDSDKEMEVIPLWQVFLEGNRGEIDEGELQELTFPPVIKSKTKKNKANKETNLAWRNMKGQQKHVWTLQDQEVF